MPLYVQSDSIKLVIKLGLTVDTHAMDAKPSSPKLGEGVERAWRRRRRACWFWVRCLVPAALVLEVGALEGLRYRALVGEEVWVEVAVLAVLRVLVVILLLIDLIYRIVVAVV